MCFFFIHFVLFLLLGNSNGEDEPQCSISPTDVQLEEGSEAEFVCSSACVTGAVFWTLNGRRVNETLSHRLNATHTGVRLSHTDLQDPSHPTSTVQCYSQESHMVLGGTTVRVYTKLRGLSCVFHSDPNAWDGVLPQLLTCSWEHHVHSHIKVTYSLTCGQCGAGSRVICASDVSHCTRRTLDLPQISFLDKNTVYVEAKTERWETRSADYTFTALQIFKVPPPKVTVTALSDHLLVQWSSLPKFRVDGRCQVRYKHTENKEIVEDQLNVTLTADERGKLRIDAAGSCRTYGVSVRCALAEAPWSDWSPETSTHTLLKRSDVKLDVWRKVLTLHEESLVHVMWKGLPSHCPGVLTFAVREQDQNQLLSTNQSWVPCAKSPCDIITKEDVLNLAVFYDGHLLVEASLLLSPFSGNDSDRRFWVSHVQTTRDHEGLGVRWKAPIDPVSAYVVDWTLDGNNFEWKRTKATAVRIHGLMDKTVYNITVTPLFDQKTGPSSQIADVCSSFTDPGNVTIVNLEAYDRSAHIIWRLSPEKCSDSVQNYTVFYGTQNGPQFNVTVKNTELYLKNLNPNTQYRIHVQVSALSGSSRSSERLFKTKIFDPQLITVYSSIGSITVVMVIALVLAVQKFNKRPVPNPALSSVALWSQNRLEKRIFPVEPFSIPSESLCELVYPEEIQDPTPLNSPAARDHKDPTTAPPQSRESPSLGPAAPAENCLLNPYRSQTVERSPRPSKKTRLVAIRQLQKTPSYVSLDLCGSV
ncbi:unnamed protein product [Knipowitschia caucasica]